MPQPTNKFIIGCKNAVKAMNVRPKQRVLVIGDSEQTDFCERIQRFCVLAGAEAELYIPPSGSDVGPNSNEAGKIIELILKLKPHILFFASVTGRWAGRYQITNEYKEIVPKWRIASMPGITDAAVSKFLSLDPDKLNDKTFAMQNKLAGKRGKRIDITTTDGKTTYPLTAFIPKDRKHPILADAQKCTRDRPMINLPAGEAYFKPLRVSGELCLKKGSIVLFKNSHRVVNNSIKLSISGSKVIGVSPGPGDEETAGLMLNEISKRGKIEPGAVVCELSIGTHAAITLANSDNNYLLALKAHDTFHLEVSNINGFFFVITQGSLKIGRAVIIDSL